LKRHGRATLYLFQEVRGVPPIVRREENLAKKTHSSVRSSYAVTSRRAKSLEVAPECARYRFVCQFAGMDIQSVRQPDVLVEGLLPAMIGE
jgi:hypothetical protein